VGIGAQRANDEVAVQMLNFAASVRGGQQARRADILL